jgi:predicted DNA-binding mobile mystery protein A
MHTKTMLLRQLQTKMAAYQKATPITRPASGWIRAIREALGMTLAQLARKLGVSKQNVQMLEKRERDYSITLQSLQQVAQAMDMQLVYALIPKEQTLEKYIAQRAETLARAIVLHTAHNMNLENQQVAEEQLEYAIEERKKQLIQEMPKMLWD